MSPDPMVDRANARNNAPDAADLLEKQLKLSLRPVQPRTEFVDHLHDRLTSPAMMTLERRQNVAFVLLLSALALMSGVFLIWLTNRFRAPEAVLTGGSGKT